ncbi:MAG: 4Fe-4S binding protein [Candidatus Aminicenantes bacterium]|nr:4Fe-4S binding protein [Candidatus Aminicenantes bacterium]MDH5384617.1 4Fe-4S binding protein [Candidatus Aminicenantes bacterium]MDH5743154.1 4Fe-4S binding protein [Candidatus Aminicenantes bacterium]
MKRQKIRKALIFILFLLFPVVLYYLSPALIVEGASKGIITGSFIVFSLLFISSLFVGRSYCGWICPGAGLQEACFRISDKRAKGGKFDRIKYFIWVPWMGIIIFSAIRTGGVHTIKPFFQTKYGISVAEPANYPVFYTVIGLITVLSFTAGKRAFCHYGCWMAPFMVIGTKIRNVFKWPSLHLEANKDKCRSCKTCTKNCPMSLEVNRMVQKRSMVNSECILCGTCVDGCPEGAIEYAFSKRI